MMRVRVTSRHFTITPDLREYIEQKVERLAHYFNRVDEAHVVLEEQRHRRIADVTVHASGVLVSSEQAAEDMRSAFDRALEKVERQIRRHKERVRNRKHGGADAVEAARLAGGTPTSVAGAVVAEKIPPGEMSTDEAVARMDELGVPFLVFRNAETGRLNVLYQRDDGHYGLMEPGE
jgi:putative sigma-54 modulation protein